MAEVERVIEKINWDEAPIHPKIVDGLGLVEALQGTFTPDGILKPAIDHLVKFPRASAAEVFEVLYRHPPTPQGTIDKAWCLLTTGEAAPAAVSSDPLDLVRVARGGEPRKPLSSLPMDSARTELKAKAAELEAEKAKSAAFEVMAAEHKQQMQEAKEIARKELQKEFQELMAKSVQDTLAPHLKRIADLEADLEAATTPVAPPTSPTA